MPGGQPTNCGGPGNQCLGREHKMLGYTEIMLEVGDINGGGPGEKLLGSRTSIGGVQDINGGVGAPKSMSGAQLFGRGG